MKYAALRNARRGLGVVFFVGGAVMASWATRIPAVADGLGLSPGALGLALFFMASGTPLVMPLCGALLARLGSRLLVKATLASSCSALVLPAVAPNVWALAASLALLGASSGALVVAQNAQGSAIERLSGEPVLNGFHALLSLGWFAGALVGAGAAGGGLSPLVHFAAAGVTLLCAGLSATRHLLVSGEDRTSASPVFVKPPKNLWVLAAISFCCLLAEGSALDWSAAYLRDALGATEGLAALGPAAFAAAMTLGRLFGDRLAQRLTPKTLVRGAALLAVSGMLLAVASIRPWTGLAGVSLLGAGLSVIFPTLLSVAGRDSAGSAGIRIAVVATAGYLGLLGGPAVIGVLAELSGLRYALLVVILLLGAIPFIVGRGGLASFRSDGSSAS